MSLISQIKATSKSAEDSVSARILRRQTTGPEHGQRADDISILSPVVQKMIHHRFSTERIQGS